jgi:hypothetical protein
MRVRGAVAVPPLSAATPKSTDHVVLNDRTVSDGARDPAPAVPPVANAAATTAATANVPRTRMRNSIGLRGGFLYPHSRALASEPIVMTPLASGCLGQQRERGVTVGTLAELARKQAERFEAEALKVGAELGEQRGT